MSKLGQYVMGMQEDAYWMGLEEFTQKYGVSNAVNWCTIRSVAEAKYKEATKQKASK